ncbi:metal-dependent hydrolase [Candidatus Omnitrophus magneticus]|uniref:Metal-dependent hydrolase n=1 Tax=Candidatus Omnitrophus magneticus TaxID=1609969 RepID=A0A0F0CSZ8_9BACT|nr:metal-dependent hydrolase [Candidatus Omnitrophus magneticus]
MEQLFSKTYDVKVIRSSNRARTVSAKIEGNVMIVSAPIHLSEQKIAQMIEDFKKKFRKREMKKEIEKNEDIKIVAERLNRKYFEGLLKVNSIKYVTNQEKRFGSCSYRSGEIRISVELARMPVWVRDYVIVHELAHLIEPNHGEKFRALENRYEFTERAKGYLIAKGFNEDD